MHAAVIAGPRQAGARGVHAGRAGWPSAAERASPASVRAARKSREHRARHHPARMQLTEHGSPHLQGGYGAAAEGARCIVADVIRRATCAFGRRNSPQAALLQRRLVRPGCAERFLSTRWRDSVRVRQLPATLFQPFLTKSSALPVVSRETGKCLGVGKPVNSTTYRWLQVVEFVTTSFLLTP